MLTLQVTANGNDLRRFAIPDMVQLAKVTMCCVEMKTNGHLFRAYPTDTIDEMVAAFDRLYPVSSIVETRRAEPTPRY